MAEGQNLSSLALEALSAGDPNAPALFSRAIDADPTDPRLILGEAEALMLAGDSDPTARLRATLRQNPEWPEGHTALAELLWELGDQHGFISQFDRALNEHSENPQLWDAYIRTWAGVGDHQAAAAAAARARRIFADPVLTLIEATHRGLNGDYGTVETLLRQVPPSLERDQVEVRHRIRLRDFNAAAMIVDRIVAAPAADLGSWAIAEVLWRQIGDPRWQWLAGSPQFIVEARIGYTKQQLEECAATLLKLHRQQRQPLGQSVRGGTQTRGRLFDRRENSIIMLRDSVQAAVDAYRQQLPFIDSDHPLLRHRNRPLRVEGGWSVRLGSAGFHVPHLHPAGVLSSAFYVLVPPLDCSVREGWLELGRPPVDLRMNLEPLACVEPEPAKLVLFPSYLYHGTRPFKAGERMSVAFDVA